MDLSIRERFARWVSVIGHPFILMPLLTGIIAYHVLPPRQALIAELVALGIVIIPAGLMTLYKVRRGTWSDLDVSHQQQRKQFYIILLPLLGVIVVIAMFANVPVSIPLGASAIVLLVAIAYLLNTRIKVSLHTGFGMFVAVTLLLINTWLGVGALILAALVAWSRIVLRRHTIAEVMVGGVLGIVVSGLFISLLHIIQIQG